MDLRHSDSLLIVLGNFHKANLSDYCLVSLFWTYRQNLKSAKPVDKMLRRWADDAKLELQACFDRADLNVFLSCSYRIG